METLRAKFHVFWDPFDAYLCQSHVSLADVDSETDWDLLLAEVVWPGRPPNVVQRSALKKALKAYCALRDAPAGSVHALGAPAASSEVDNNLSIWHGEVGTLQEQPEDRRRSAGPLVGNYARNFSKCADRKDAQPRRVVSTPAADSCSSPPRSEGQPTLPPVDEPSERLLAEGQPEGSGGMETGAAAQTHATAHVRFADAPVPAPACRRTHQVADCSERELNEMLDSLLESRRTTELHKGDPRIFSSVPAAEQSDLLQLADALLEREAEAVKKPARKRQSSSSRLHRKGASAAAETGPSALNAAEQAINAVMHSEFQVYRRQLTSAPPTRFKSALLPNFKGRAESAPKVNKASLQEKNLELHDCLGIEGTVMQHWLGGWRQRGRPNRGAELLAMQETTLQQLTQRRHGRPVEDSWALRNVLRAYGNAKSELLRNMIADETAMKVDEDGDDALNVEEFRQLYRQTHPDKPIADEMIRQAWEFADRDHNGEVDFREMMLWLDKATLDATGIFVPEK